MRFFACSAVICLIVGVALIACRKSSDASLPACSFDGGSLRPFDSPAGGTLTGSEANVRICQGGAFAYLERAGGLQVVIDSDLSENPDDVHFQNPAGAVSGTLNVFVTVPSGATTTYSNDKTCGLAAYCISFPVPASVNCSGGPGPCSPGCSLQGPAFGPVCTAVTPEVCYSAQSENCGYAGSPAGGSWTLTISSESAYTGTDVPAGSEFIVHGSFTANLVKDFDTTFTDDAGAASETLSLQF